MIIPIIYLLIGFAFSAYFADDFYRKLEPGVDKSVFYRWVGLFMIAGTITLPAIMVIGWCLIMMRKTAEKVWK